MFLINVSLMLRDKSCIGNLSFSVVLPKDLKPVLDKNTKSSPIAWTLSRDTQPIPLITSLSAMLPIMFGLSYIAILLVPNTTNLP